MDSPQKKAGSKKKIPEAVQLASAWALVSACVFPVSSAVGYATAYTLDHYHVHCSQSSFLRCDQLTDAEATEVTALGIGMLCCAALQAATAVLALRLPCRRALAYLALVLTILGHCMYGAAARLFLVADPGDLFFRICCTVGIFAFAAGDIISFLALLLGGEE